LVIFRSLPHRTQGAGVFVLRLCWRQEQRGGCGGEASAVRLPRVNQQAGKRGDEWIVEVLAAEENAQRSRSRQGCLLLRREAIRSFHELITQSSMSLSLRKSSLPPFEIA